MDALHPRLLVADFPACFAFYDAVLPPLLGAHRVQGAEWGPYAHWDVGEQAVLVLFDRAAMAGALGEEPPAPRGDMFVCRVADVDAAYALALRSGGTAVLPPADRPEWGATVRTAHLRDPEGRLIEFQSY
ncbi:glyoxalase/bleomycin resistance/extradiol dioxygenase family protein [Kitasatospora sp. NA04385]|uniref:VOC family protein n=1 Tax=Kitasatospora sp. NA04385 TaxID=2742135 RepID=UPI001590C40B|nr:VOC family protein [Kitasatospora sp. NA04385]QKW18223.1 glyoxalase/bleomycin resistance/extradiol dioxygenase family protein [Kitasatospora sp. NA04385]